MEASAKKSKYKFAVSAFFGPVFEGLFYFTIINLAKKTRSEKFGFGLEKRFIY